MEFKDRKNEIREIKEILGSNKFEFLVLYGRRRVGKTELILNSIKNKKSIYYFSVGEKNLERFYEVCKSFDKNVENLKEDFGVIIDYLKDKIDVLVIDEFQEMIRENKNILNVLQFLVDTKLKHSKLKLVLLGSSVSMINSKVLSYQSPLYGRKTNSINLKPVSFFDMHEFFPDRTMEELVEIYGFADGIPFYLIKIDSPLWKFIQKEVSEEKGFLKDEVNFLMKYEFEDTSTYKLILEAIANGKTKLGEIRDFVGVRRTDLGPYLQNLIDVDFIKREVSLTENPKSRNGRYYLKDNFLKFWFRYIYPNLSSIESKAFDVSFIKENYSQYLGKIFEKICEEFVVRESFFKFNRIGRWWHKDKEIDVVALNDSKKEILLGECKWKERVNALEILKDLEEKSKFVDWNLNKRKEIFVVFAKSFSKRVKEFSGRKVYCFDLKNMKNTGKKSKKEEKIKKK
jgi:uncharacterized protein